MFRGAVTLEQLTSNRAISDAWREHQHREHMERIKHVKHALDNKPPKEYPHLSTRFKKEQGIEERYLRIERENRLLLDKMSWIMSHNTLDNQPPRPFCGSTQKIRKQTDEKIMSENQALLKRIQTQKPYYNRKVWDEHSVKHDYYLEVHRQFPKPGEKAAAPQSLFEIANRGRGRSASPLPPMNNRFGTAEQMKLAEDGSDPLNNPNAARITSPNGKSQPLPYLQQKLAAEHAQHYKSEQEYAAANAAALAASGRVGADEIELLKEGKTLDGEQLIITVTESKGQRGANKPAAAPAAAGAGAAAAPGAVTGHQFIFRSYRFSNNERSVVRVSYADIEGLVMQSGCDCSGCNKSNVLPLTQTDEQLDAAQAEWTQKAQAALKAGTPIPAPESKSAAASAATATDTKTPAAAAGAGAHPELEILDDHHRPALARWLLSFLRFQNKHLTFNGRRAELEKLPAPSAIAKSASAASPEKKQTKSSPAKSPLAGGPAKSRASAASPTPAGSSAAAAKAARSKSPLGAGPAPAKAGAKAKSTPTSAVPPATHKVGATFKLAGLNGVGDLKGAEVFVAVFQRAGKDWSLVGQTDRVLSVSSDLPRALYLDQPTKSHDIDLRIAVYRNDKKASAPAAFVDHRDCTLLGTALTTYQALRKAPSLELLVAAAPAGAPAAAAAAASTPLGRLAVTTAIRELGDIFDVVLTASCKGLGAAAAAAAAGAAGGKNSGPLLACYAKNPNTGIFEVCGQTERLSAGAALVWTEKLHVRHMSLVDTEVKLAVFDVRDQPAAATAAAGSIDVSRDLRGHAVFSLQQFMNNKPAAAAGDAKTAPIKAEYGLVLDGKEVSGAVLTVQLSSMARLAKHNPVHAPPAAAATPSKPQQPETKTAVSPAPTATPAATAASPAPASTAAPAATTPAASTAKPAAVPAK